MKEAITRMLANHVRRRCQELLRENEQHHAGLGKADVCGKCLVKVPCSHGIPRAEAPGG